MVSKVPQKDPQYGVRIFISLQKVDCTVWDLVHTMTLTGLELTANPAKSRKPGL